MSNQPIQPDSQLIAGPSRSNDNALVNDSRDNTDLSRMMEPLERKDKRSKLHTDKQNLESFCISYVKMTMIIWS